MSFHDHILPVLVSLDARNTALETKSGDDTPPVDLAAKLDELASTIGDRVKALETKSATLETKSGDEAKIATRLDKLEARVSRPSGEPAPEKDTARVAFASYLRSGTAGVNGMPELERKSLSVSVNTAGGYLAPPQFTLDFVRDLTLVSPIRAIAAVKTASSHTVLVPKRTGITNAVWQGEAVATIGSQPAFDQQAIEVKNLATHVDINNQLIDDAEADVEAEVRTALAEDFAAKEGAAFVKGDGVLEPRGFMTVPLPTVLNGHATEVQPDALISIMYALAPFYRSRGTWVMSGLALAEIRKLKDDRGNYLWQPGIQAGQPETILGRPVVEADDMPEVAAGGFPIVFGDFGTAYRIYDRKTMEVKVNPFLLMTTDQTRFHAFRRTGGDVVQPNALRRLKMATS